MIAILSLLALVAISLLVGRVATVALTATGMPREIARFQARSALTGAGFTTSESESILSHPVRRRIVMQLMLVGNIGLVGVLGTFVTAFAREGGLAQQTQRLLVLVVGLFVLVAVARNRWVGRRLHGVFVRLAERMSDIEITDYGQLLHLAGDYVIDELLVEEDDWIADSSLAEADLPHEGILILGIARHDGTYLGAPTGATRINPGDTLLVYGRAATVAQLDDRRRGYAGDSAHDEAVRLHRESVAAELRQQ